MDDVEAARAEAEVLCLDVHDDLIAGPAGADQRRVGDRRARRRRLAAVQRDAQPLLAAGALGRRRIGLEHGCAA